MQRESEYSPYKNGSSLVPGLQAPKQTKSDAKQVQAAQNKVENAHRTPPNKEPAHSGSVRCEQVATLGPREREREITMLFEVVAAPNALPILALELCCEVRFT